MQRDPAEKSHSFALPAGDAAPVRSEVDRRPEPEQRARGGRVAANGRVVQSGKAAIRVPPGDIGTRYHQCVDHFLRRALAGGKDEWRKAPTCSPAICELLHIVGISTCGATRHESRPVLGLRETTEPCRHHRTLAIVPYAALHTS